MVTRAINLKVIVLRQTDEAGFATAIWSTHREVNLATFALACKRGREAVSIFIFG